MKVFLQKITTGMFSGGHHLKDEFMVYFFGLCFSVFFAFLIRT